LLPLYISSTSPHPALNQIKKDYGKQATFVSITFDEAREVQKTLKRFPLDFIQLVGAKKFLDEIGQAIYPKTIILDASGKVSYINESFDPAEAATMRAEIDKVLN
jgi:thiol-disulfide isomerase/thioredoxin